MNIETIITRCSRSEVGSSFNYVDSNKNHRKLCAIGSTAIKYCEYCKELHEKRWFTIYECAKEDVR